jgi:hypothetical protein
MLNGLDLLILLKLSIQPEIRVPSKKIAEDLYLEPSEVTRSLKRCRAAGLLYQNGSEKRVNRAGLLEFLVHGFRYVFPAQTGSLTRGIPTSIAAEPLKAHFIDTGEPPPVWPYMQGNARGIAFMPLHKRVPKAALRDPRLYELLALVDAIRGTSVRERQMAKEELTKRLGTYA